MKSKKAKAKEPEYRIRFVLKDGSLVMNRFTGDWVVKDKDFLPITMARDAVEKGVRILSHKMVDEFTVEAQVEWI
jgi:glycerol-3-phosphate dehydrogenase